MLNRNRRLAFIEIINDKGEFAYGKMTGFTEFTVNLNPKEYSRKYIDDPTELSEVVAYQPTISYKFDMIEDDKSQEPFVFAADYECLGKDALVKVIVVEMKSFEEDELDGMIREYIIVPDSEGDDSNVYTFSGTMKAASPKTSVRVRTTDNWKTCNIVQ